MTFILKFVVCIHPMLIVIFDRLCLGFLSLLYPSPCEELINIIYSIQNAIYSNRRYER